MHILYLATDTTNYLSLSFDFSKYVILVIQSLSRVQLFATPWTVAHQAPLSYIISRSLFKFMFIELMMLSSHLMLCHLILLLPSIFLSIRVFSNELALHIRWPRYWSFIFSNNPSKEYSGLISFRVDWFDLFAVQVSQESSPTPQFKSISSSALSLLYGSCQDGRIEGHALIFSCENSKICK